MVRMYDDSNASVNFGAKIASIKYMQTKYSKATKAHRKHRIYTNTHIYDTYLLISIHNDSYKDWYVRIPTVLKLFAKSSGFSAICVFGYGAKSVILQCKWFEIRWVLLFTALCWMMPMMLLMLLMLLLQVYFFLSFFVFFFSFPCSLFLFM